MKAKRGRFHRMVHFLVQLLILVRGYVRGLACMPFFLIGMIVYWLWFYTIQAACAGWECACGLTCKSN